MRHKTEKYLNDTLSLLRGKVKEGTLEREQVEAVTSVVRELRSAVRTRDPVKLRKAVDRAARVFLSNMQ